MKNLNNLASVTIELELNEIESVVGGWSLPEPLHPPILPIIIVLDDIPPLL